MRTGKIARLPHPIREQLNRRLEASENYEPILNWLNALPEARQVIDDHFAGLPISKQNLSDWRSGGFSEWQDRQDAADFLTNLDDQSDPNPQTASSPSTGRMALWLSLQYALAARALVRSPVDQPARWARLREICADIARLRRSDLFAERLVLDRAWLAFEESNTAQKKEQDFWAWTERPDIREKLFPDREGGLSPETIEKIEKDSNSCRPRAGDGSELTQLTQLTPCSPDQAQSSLVKPGKAKKNKNGCNTLAQTSPARFLI